MAVDTVPSDSLHILRSRIISGFFALICKLVHVLFWVSGRFPC